MATADLVYGSAKTRLKKIFTIFNEIVPQIYGEGNTESEAVNNMIAEAKDFAKDYAENFEYIRSKRVFCKTISK